MEAHERDQDATDAATIANRLVGCFILIGLLLCGTVLTIAYWATHCG